MRPMIPKDQKIYYLHYDDVRGDVLRPAQGTTPAAANRKLFKQIFYGIVFNAEPGNI